MTAYVIYSGEYNRYSDKHDYNIVDIYSNKEEAISTWKKIKNKNNVDITNPHYFIVRKIVF